MLKSFECEIKKGKKKENWNGKITSLKNYGSHYEIQIESRSGIMVMYGETSRGMFACMPDFKVGCHLVNLKDRFWNTEKLIRTLGQIDGKTVESALYALSDELEL